jgi:hypothetical protein
MDTPCFAGDTWSSNTKFALSRNSILQNFTFSDNYTAQAVDT